mmetsp:Transcript_33891/g.87002  ORF Transcript_33891/g.87002 Transcript_33891/m.87002 type:complete len:148 (-) Transcript_33891:53-496(-)|eukprot:CAMPEP_0113883808 /NCGR_PEP_ID=MMETSP0780_2-20120614/9833_1 /TAXON_ID=652834 /ORGANISM="Palpitomonas bilix" /LENGTH=147 /DNA_ID=CAMNT_0000871209 /DNA_START=251 /DNA_END=694 /DNA_ORIENTATION=+ /assembly_acc=CAM_ASM_000599
MGKHLLTGEQLAQLELAFKAFDTSNTGTLNIQELGAAFAAFGYTPTEAELQDKINEVNGKADFDSFVTFMTSSLADIPHEQEIEATFRKLDVDRDGMLSREDIAASVSSLGSPLLDEEVQEVLRELGERKGKVSFEAFKKALLTCTS